MKTLFVDVILPLPLEGSFTYRVPNVLNDKVRFGVRVVVPFGGNKLYSAVVESVHENPPQQFSVKYIVDVIDDFPVISERQYELWKWISEYYMCTMGEVMAASLPSALRLSGETKVSLHPRFDGDITALNPFELNVVELLLQKEALTVSEVSKRLQLAKIMPVIKSLTEKNVVITDEEIRNPYKPKKEMVISVSEQFADEKKFLELVDTLNANAKTSAQADTLLFFIMQCRDENRKYDFKAQIPKSQLLKNEQIKPSSLNTLIKKGILVSQEKVVSRLADFSETSDNIVNLSSAQQSAFEAINDGFSSKDVVLLHGITGSGKTEIYIKLIDEVISKGKQVLYLLPEIALTTQIVNRLRRFFGNKVGVYHSKFNEYERVEIWNRVLNDGCDESAKYRLILGARSALFLPYCNLGLIIVDEEHDGSYRQSDPAPRYNARDVAIMLAKIHNTNVLLGTATPSLESYYNVKLGKFGLVELMQRYAESTLPEIFTVNVASAKKNGEMRGLFSNFLIEKISEALKNGEQVILFQNRRGYAVKMICHTCESMPTCKYCDVTLTYHRKTNLLKCHYCGYAINAPSVCPQCGSTDVEMTGFGTEQVEDTLAEIFPDAKIARMDLDTTRSKNAYQQIISDFEQHKTDILVGTQMVTKGLDFDRVSVVGILNADSLLSFPDFRAFEHAFQLLSQVSGRAGRKEVPGKVVIQTFQPHHPALSYVETNDYQEMYASQIDERKKFLLPPVTRMIKLTLKHPDEKIVADAATFLQVLLRQSFGKFVMGPSQPLVSKIQNYYLQDFWIKLSKDNSINEKKRKLSEILSVFKQHASFKKVRCVINVDA